MANLRTTVILKTDIVDFTLRAARQTPSEMGRQSKQHKQFISEIAVQHQGSIFEDEGDAYWIEFPSVTTAALAAIEMHQSLRAWQAGKQEKNRLAIRAVITVGDILYQDKDSIGTTKSLTARIEKITPADEIYLSHAAWLVLNKAEVYTEYVNEFNFKGFHEPERVYKVDQQHKTRVLTNQFIVFTDVRGFTRFIRSASIQEIESFLLDCDDLMNEICEHHGGTIRQISGDQYFCTFLDRDQTLAAIERLYHAWKGMVERYKLGISIGVHKGNLNVIRSFVYGDDIHVTVYLTDLDRSYHAKKDEFHVITSGKAMEEFQRVNRNKRFCELDPTKLTNEIHQMICREHGAFEFICSDPAEDELLTGLV